MSSVKWEPIARSYNPLKAGSIDGTDTIPHDHGVVRAMQVCFYPVSECTFLLLFIFFINVDSHLSIFFKHANCDSVRLYCVQFQNKNISKEIMKRFKYKKGSTFQ